MKKKTMTRILASLLSALMLSETLPIHVWAEEAQNEARFEAELLASVPADAYPNGMFDFLTPRMETSEDIKGAEIVIVRRGNTDSAASVTFKAVDISAEYGTDYVIELEDGIRDRQIEKNEDSVMYITQVDIASGSEAELLAESSGPAFELPEGTAEMCIAGPEDDGEDAGLEEEDAGFDGSFESAYELQTGKKLNRFDWKTEDEAAAEAFAEAQADLYSEIVGHEITLDFAPGEYQKILRFDCLQDDISEDEEQVLFVLCDAEGAELSANPTGYMNIVDDEEKEKITYEFAEYAYSVPADETHVTVKLTRTSGIFRYSSVDLVTSEYDAIAGEHYDPFVETVTFVPGQVSKQVVVNIKKHPAIKEVMFTVKTADDSTSAVITIEPQINSSAIEYVSVSAGGFQSVSGYRAAATAKMRFTSLPQNTSNAYVVSTADKLKFSHSECTFGGNDQLDLTMVESIEIFHSEDGKGTYYSYETGGCNSKTVSGYYNTKSTTISVGSHVLSRRDGNFTGVEEELKLSDNDRVSNATIRLSSIGSDGCKDTNGLFDNTFTLKYEPLVVDVGSKDGDATVTPRIYTAKSRFTEGDKDINCGSIKLSDGTTRGIFYNDSVISMLPEWNTRLSAAERDGLYLWGVKVEAVASGSQTEYFYINETEINLKELYNGKYREYYTGKGIPRDRILLSFRMDDGKTYNGFRLLPVFRQKMAYTKLHMPENVQFAKDSFSNDDLVVTGRLDTLQLDTVSYDGMAVGGWYALAKNMGDRFESSFDDEKAYYVDDRLKKDTDENSAFSIRSRSAAGCIGGLYDAKWQKPECRKEYNFGAAIPGKLSFVPNALFNYVEPATIKPAVTVAVNPASDPEGQDVGTVVYLPTNGEDPQSSQYTGMNPDTKLLEGTEIVISPYELRPYDLAAVFEKDAPEDYMYKTTWLDFTGDADRDGVLSDEELRALGEAVGQVYPGYRPTYVGNAFGYTPRIIGQSVVYYQFGLVPQSASGKTRSLGGTVSLYGRSIYENSLGGDQYTKMPLPNAIVRVGDFETTTDENGRWRIESASFLPGEVYSVNITYSGKVYTVDVGVNQELEQLIPEYDTFNVYGLNVKKGSSKITATTIEVGRSESKHRYAFKISHPSGVEPARVEVDRYSKSNQYVASYEAYYDSETDEWVIRTESAYNDFINDKGDYSINTNKENALNTGDHYIVTIIDNYGTSYIPHELGITYITSLSYINIVNAFLPEKAGVVLEFIDTVGATFDLGLVAMLDDLAADGLKDLGVEMANSTSDGTLIKTITWGFNDSKLFEKKYKPKEEKKKDGSDEKSDTKSAAIDDAKQAAENLETVSEKPDADKTDEEKAKAAENGDDEKKETAVDAIDNAVSKDSKNKKKSEFAANIKITLSLAVSLEFGYYESPNPDEQSGWYFRDFLVVATLKTDASAGYSYMTPIGVKVGIKAALGGSIAAAFGFSPYYPDPSNPAYMFVEGDAGTIDLTAMGNRSADRKLNVYGKLMIRPTITLTVTAALFSDKVASVSLEGGAAFDMNFTTGHTGSGYVTLSAKLKISLLFGLIKKEWNIANKKIEMFEYGGGASLLEALCEDDLRYEPITEADMVSDFVSGSAWYGGTPGEADLMAADILSERMLKEGFNYESDPKIEVINTGSEPYETDAAAIIIFLDVKDDDPSVLVLKYSILTNGVWSEPQAFDPASKGDDSHDITYIGEDKIIISWSTYVGDPGTDTVAERLSSRDLRTVMYDCRKGTFGEIRELTKQNDIDNYADSEASFVYYEDEAGKPNLIALYRKSLYLPEEEGDELLVGDVINSLSVYAYRVYDFDTDDWRSDYPGDYFLGGTEYGSMAEEDRRVFAEKFYGQYFVDNTDYLYVSNKDVFVDPYGGARSGGIWTRMPTSGDLALSGIGTYAKIVEHAAGTYGNYGVFAFVMDFDGSEASTDEREIFLEVYDFKQKKMSLPIRLTYNGETENNLVMSDMTDGLRLFYNEQGNINCLNLSRILDFALTGNVTVDGKERFYILENRMNGIIEAPYIVYSAVEDTNGSTEDKHFASFSVDWTDEYEIVFFTESKITYRDGILPNSPEAALPENQYAEQQIYARMHIVTPVTTALTDEAGNPLVYPENDDEGHPIDYTDFTDFTGQTGKVKAGDPVLAKNYEELWLPCLQITDERGANFTNIDFIFDEDLNLTGIYEKMYSHVVEIDGTRVVSADTGSRSLIAAKYNPMNDEFYDMTAEFEADNLDRITEYTEEFPLELKVKNPNYAASLSLSVRVSEAQNGGRFETVATEFIGTIDSYESRNVTLNVPLPEDLHGMELRAELYYTLPSGREIPYDTLAYTYEEPESLEIGSVERELIDRNTVRYTVTVHNTACQPLDDARVTFRAGEDEWKSDAFGVPADGYVTVMQDITVPDSLYTETRENGFIYEKAYVTIETSAGITVTDELTRVGAQRYEALMEEAALFNAVTGEPITGSVTLEKGAYLLPEALTGEYASGTLMIAAKSEKTRVASVDAIGGIYACDKGSTTVHLYAAPNVTGYLARLSDADELVSYNDFNTLPSALVKEYDIEVTVGGSGSVSAKDTRVPSGTPLPLNERIAVPVRTENGSETTLLVVGGTTLANAGKPTMRGYIFDGWYTDETFTEIMPDDTVLTPDTVLYAAFKVDPLRQIILTIDELDAVVFGKTVTNDVAPIIRNDRTMLPARFVAEALGAAVEWEETGIDKGIVTITRDDVTIVITIGSDKATVNGKTVALDSPAFIENDRTYTPIRFIAEALGATVEWTETGKDAGIVTITKSI